MVPIIFHCVFNEVCDDHYHLDLIDLRIDFSHADHSQLDISFLRDGSESVQDQLDHLVHVALFDVELRILSIHPNECEQLRYDLIFTVNFVLDVDHEFPVHLDRNIFLLNQ